MNVRIMMAAALMAVTVPAWAQSTLNDADKDFVQRAIQGGQAEMWGGKMAQQQAERESVRNYGAQALAEHGKVTEELRALAQSKGLATAMKPDFVRMVKLEGLKDETGPDFDRAYIDQLGIEAHQDAIKLFNKTQAEGADPDIKAFIVKTLPMLQSQLSQAKAALP